MEEEANEDDNDETVVVVKKSWGLTALVDYPLSEEEEDIYGIYHYKLYSNI